jgi:hypothetical protein
MISRDAAIAFAYASRFPVQPSRIAMLASCPRRDTLLTFPQQFP